MFFLKCLNDSNEIDDLIKREIRARTRFILCDSENARKSNWVTTEKAYIEELHKPYDIIDITASDEEIKSKLNEIFRKEHLFISYTRELSPAIEVINERLSKYDFATSFIDRFELLQVSFYDDIEANIKKAVEKGHFIPLLSHHSTMPGRFSQVELNLAIDYDINENSILPIYLDKVAKEYFKHKLGNYDSIDLSDKYTNNHGQPNSNEIPYRHGSLDNENTLKRLGDDIVNSILVRLQGWGNIRTYGNQFRHGIECNIDTTEADKLSELIVEHLEGVDCGNYFNGPGMLIVLGNMYASGECVRQDLEKARQYFEEAHHEYGISIEHLMDKLKK